MHWHTFCKPLKAICCQSTHCRVWQFMHVVAYPPGVPSLAVHACCCLSTGGGVHQSGWCLPMYVSEGMSCSQMNGFHARLQLHPQRRSRSCLAYVCRLRPSPTILFVLIPGERQPVSVITSIVSHLLYKARSSPPVQARQHSAISILS